MVWPLAPAAGTARAFSAGLKERKTTKKVEVPHGCFVRRRVLHHHTSRSLCFRFETRSTSLRHRVYVVLENKEAPNFDQSLLDLARKTVNPFASSSEDLRVQSLNKTVDRGNSSERELEEGRQIAKDSGRINKSGSEFKATRLGFDLANRRISLPDLKRHFWKNVGNGSRNFEVTRLAPLPPFTGSLIALLGFVVIIGVVLDKWIGRVTRGAQLSNTSRSDLELSKPLKAPTGIPIFLETDLKKKESVEWVNMVLGKLWKIYRLGLESWLLGLLQPLIDNLQKPGYVSRVEIEQFYLGDEPIGIRSVERRASRRVNDLQ